VTRELPPRRHDLVWLSPGWPRALVLPLAPEALREAERWLARGLPAVASRLDARAGEEAVALGIALPPAPERRRISLSVAPGAVVRVERPLRLAGALASAPAGFRPKLEALCVDARALGLSLGVYGSLSWQHLSGDRYLTESSDVDVLLEPRTRAELAGALELFRSRAALDRPRLDGELLLEGGRGVSLRELLANPRRVLVKSRTSVSLLSLSLALGSLGSPEAAA